MKKRLDLVLLEQGLFPSREKARTAIMTGRVLVAGKKEMKAGTQVAEDAVIDVTGQDLLYVSRGGLKLEKAVQEFLLDLKDKTVLDIGASTGGFTHCSLLNGAKKVFAVDVGYGQLAWELRQDDRVVVLEKVNARYLRYDQIGENADMITIDASFISLTKLIPPLLGFLKENGCFIVLIKPQFEAGREKVGKKGVVRDKETHLSVIKSIVSFCREHGLFCQALTYSPIRGPEGNIEYLAQLKKETHIFKEDMIEAVVEDAFSHFSTVRENK